MAFFDQIFKFINIINNIYKIIKFKIRKRNIPNIIKILQKNITCQTLTKVKWN